MKPRPWQRKNPRRKAPVKLTAKAKAAAREAARRAGRPYPNLVDNMNAARQQQRDGVTCRRRHTSKPRSSSVT
jgi:hypothetical protein